jgi:hypothetical protein
MYLRWMDHRFSNDAVQLQRLYGVELYEKIIAFKFERLIRKRLWPNSRYYPSIHLEGLKNITEILVGESVSWLRFQGCYLPNTNQRRYKLSQFSRLHLLGEDQSYIPHSGGNSCKAVTWKGQKKVSVTAKMGDELNCPQDSVPVQVSVMATSNLGILPSLES